MRFNNLQIVVMAAGKGQRMASSQAKVLHLLAGKPMIYHVISTCLKLNPARLIIVLGHQAEIVKQRITQDFTVPVEQHTIHFALQDPPLGTGHAVWSARQEFAAAANLTLIVNGDSPLLSSLTLKKMVQSAIDFLPKQTPLTMLTFNPPQLTGYGRVVRDTLGNVKEIVEEKEATPAEKQIAECNVGVYVGETKNLLKQLQKIISENRPGEYYLTDIVRLTVDAGLQVRPFLLQNYLEGVGINDQDSLQAAEKALLNAASE